METPNLDSMTGEERKLCEEVAALIDLQVEHGFTVEGIGLIVQKSFRAGYLYREQQITFEQPCSGEIQ